MTDEESKLQTVCLLRIAEALEEIAKAQKNKYRPGKVIIGSDASLIITPCTDKEIGEPEDLTHDLPK